MKGGGAAAGVSCTHGRATWAFFGVAAARAGAAARPTRWLRRQVGASPTHLGEKPRYLLRRAACGNLADIVHRYCIKRRQLCIEFCRVSSDFSWRAVEGTDRPAKAGLVYRETGPLRAGRGTVLTEKSSYQGLLRGGRVLGFIYSSARSFELIHDARFCGCIGRLGCGPIHDTGFCGAEVSRMLGDMDPVRFVWRAVSLVLPGSCTPKSTSAPCYIFSPERVAVAAFWGAGP